MSIFEELFNMANASSPTIKKGLCYDCGKTKDFDGNWIIGDCTKCGRHIYIKKQE